MYFLCYIFCSYYHIPISRKRLRKAQHLSWLPPILHNPTHTADTDSTPETKTDAIIMYTTTWCGDCRRAKRVFADFGVPYVEVNIGDDDEAAELVQTLNNGLRSVPTILFPDGSVLVEPSNATLMTKLQPYTLATR